MRVISLGWGVQSFALAAMSALGVLPKVDAAIHADTTYERAETYEFARKWTPWLEARGVRVVTVQAKDDVTQVPFDDTGRTHIPLYVVNTESGKVGKLRRSCTGRWKIRPQRKYINDWLNESGIERKNGTVEQWFGITLDEVTRMKPADVQYITHSFPFIEMLDRPWTRHMVMRWLTDHSLEIPVKSSCVMCPFHSDAMWREIKESKSGDWQRAISIDEAIRHKRPDYLAYVHRNCIPLVDVDVRNAQDHGQLTLWEEDECEGMCFL
jgi:hypothetical protein